MLIPVPKRYMSISNFFTQPMMRERETIRKNLTGSDDIFKVIGKTHETMNFEEASAHLSDLSHAIIPFDQSKKEFKQLLKRTKTLLQSNQGGLHLYNLIDAILKLRLNFFDSLIKQKIENGDYSRTSQDIASLLAFVCKRTIESQNSQDVKKVWISLAKHKLLPELKYLNIHELKAEHLSYLSDSFVLLSSFHKSDKEEKEGVFLSDGDL